MRYAAFRIQNFKGIADTRIEIESKIGSGTAISLVGLNESGKTTVLEAIHSFSPDETTTLLLSGKTLEKVPPESLIPRQDQANFNGNISVTAEIVVTPDDYKLIRERAFKRFGVSFLTEGLPEKFNIERRLTYSASKHVNTNVYYYLRFDGIEPGKRKSKKLDQPYITNVINIIAEMLPPIKYFPTFLFEFPDQIFLGETTDGRNQIYRSMFQDLLTSLGRGYEIDRHIIDRLEFSPEKHGVFAAFLTWYFGSYNKAAVDSIMAEASAGASAVVMKRWNEVFTDKISNKKIIIDFEASKSADSELPVGSIRFMVEENGKKFKVSERSLGFRWFLCFLLFTQFISKDEGRNALYLFDEPASNLHARAQQQLLDSFDNIVKNSGGLIYSTHSHHMVSPSWLEKTYIVENSAIRYDGDEFSAAITESTKIEAIPYRQFVSAHPDKKSYFQPILDRLDYAPSDLEFIEPVLMVEGKNDFYVMKYFIEILLKSKKTKIMPGTGAHGLSPLIALYLGWGKKFVALLDGDKAGIEARDRYREEFALPDDKVAALIDLVPGSGIKAVESLLGDDGIKKIQTQIGSERKPSKKEIGRYFQEALAKGRVEKFSKSTLDNFRALEAGFLERIDSQKF